jgi:signal transduction histidine kinase
MPSNKPLLENAHVDGQNDEILPQITSIRAQRIAGDLAAAIATCRLAILTHPQNVVLRRLMVDLLFQSENFSEAFIALGDYLSLISPSRKQIGAFAKRYRSFRRALPPNEMERYALILKSAMSEGKVNKIVSSAVRQVIAEDLSPQLTALGELELQFSAAIEDDYNFESFVKIERAIEEQDGIERLGPLLDQHILRRRRSSKTYRIDLYCASIYERLRELDSASKILRELLLEKFDSIATRTLFRVNRLRRDYSQVDELLTTNPDLTKSRDFNILYELVYYFEAKNDFDAVQATLRNIDRSFSTNLPVKRTVRNFYIRFGMPEDAKRLESEIADIYLKRKGSEGEGKYEAAVKETEMEVASKVQDLYSQLEHQKQLAAISDLTTGISHELGQPITNIRYTIQFYARLFEKNVSKAAIDKVFASILEETERMGGLIRRLAPLTSSRSVVESFDVMERIRKRVDAESPRLIQNQIITSVKPKHAVMLNADPVKFDQLISNLLLNAIDAITEKGPIFKTTQKNKINIQVDAETNEIRLSFSDTGIGIPFANRNKIFDPFFSTKAPGKGEGLGLFIVWNILKMLGGRIAVDPKYSDGARFIATIPKSAE